MLDPSWALTRPLLWLALAALLAALVVRAVRKDRLEYRRFKRYRTTARRQATFRRWLRESFLTFGGLSAGALLLSWGFVVPLLQELVEWPGVRDIRALIGTYPEISVAIIAGLVIGGTLLLVVAVRAARTEGEGVVSIGDIQAMLPRNRQELRLGALLSLNAGLVEEMLFRLALPAVVFGATGSALAAVIVSVLLFGALHIYQGISGVIGTTVIGAFMMLLYAVTGTIVVPIVLHALFDLRSLVLIPAAVMGVHKIDGTKQAFLPPSLTASGSTPAPPDSGAPSRS